MKLNKLQRKLLVDCIKAKLLLWDTSLKAEKALGLDIDSSGSIFEAYCSSIDGDGSDCVHMSDEELTEMFELDS